MKNIKRLFELIEQKYEFNAANAEAICNGQSRKSWNTAEMYVRELAKELDEVKEEMKPNNSVHLEDELGDILWDFLNLVYILKLDGFIESEDAIFKRCEKKFSERVEGIKSGVSWGETKSKQKEELKNEHTAKYFDNKR